jgi:hypothetical protein
MTTTYTSAAQDAAAIRAAYKVKGWTPRMVSVRAENYSGGSSIDVRIKDPAVPLIPAREIAEGKERIRYDEMSHEILQGGNRFVSVGYTDEARAGLAAPWLADLAVPAERLKTAPDGHGFDVPNRPGAVLFKGMHGYGFVAYLGDRRLGESQDLAGTGALFAVASQGYEGRPW